MREATAKTRFRKSCVVKQQSERTRSAMSTVTKIFRGRRRGKRCPRMTLRRRTTRDTRAIARLIGQLQRGAPENRRRDRIATAPKWSSARRQRKLGGAGGSRGGRRAVRADGGARRR